MVLYQEETVNDPGPPLSAVLGAFGATGSPVPIAGGQGQSYRSGNVVLKPAQDDEETNWVADFYLSISCEGSHVPQLVRAETGGFVHLGWQAWEYIQGQYERGRWMEKIETCVRFHKAIADLSRPSFLDRREVNPWIIADEVTWGEREIDHHPRIAPVVDRLRAVLRPVQSKSQLIHGDFGGNVLFAEGLDPAIIDFSPYWRPVEFAIGVIVADAIVWEGADESLMDVGTRFNDFDQHLARAELRRVIELEALHSLHGRDMIREIDAHLPLITNISARCR